MSTSAPVGLMPVPDGETADFNVYHLTGTQINFIVAYSVTLAIATVTLLLRIYTRVFVIQSFGLDDVLIILSLFASIGFFGVSVDSMKYGFGRHLWEITPPQMAVYLEYLVGICTTYIWAPAFTKLSFLVLLHRLNKAIWFRSIIYFLAFAIFAYTTAIILIIAYPCRPIKGAAAGECLNQCGLWQAILNIITDFLAIAMPIPMVYQLKMPLKQKLALSAIFSTSIFVTVICIVRITYIMSLQNNPDVGYTQGRAAVWSSVELNIGIACASVVVLKPFIRKHFPGVFSSYGYDTNDKNSGMTPRANLSARLGRKDPNSFHLSSIAADNNEGDNFSKKNKFGITVTKNFETSSTEDIITSNGNYSHV